jgi:hypothetical protein
MYYEDFNRAVFWHNLVKHYLLMLLLAKSSPYIELSCNTRSGHDK